MDRGSVRPQLLVALRLRPNRHPVMRRAQNLNPLQSLTGCVLDQADLPPRIIIEVSFNEDLQMSLLIVRHLTLVSLHHCQELDVGQNLRRLPILVGRLVCSHSIPNALGSPHSSHA